MSQQRHEPPLPPTPETATPYAAADTPVYSDSDPLGRYADPQGEESSTGTGEAAKNEAANLAQTAKDSGGQVASTAKQRGQEVASEAAGQARNLLGETRQQLADQAGSQQQRAASGLRSIGDELGSMADSSEQSGVGAQVARQVADQVHEVAGWLDSRDPKALLEDVRDFARRRPGTFLLGAALAGLAVGRLTRAGVDTARGGDDSESQAGSPMPAAPAMQTTGTMPDPYATPPVTPFSDPAATGYLDPTRPVSSPSGDYSEAGLGIMDDTESGEPLR